MDPAKAKVEEARLLERVRRDLALESGVRSGRTGGAVEVTDVRLAGAYPDTQLQILISDDTLPDCVFGLRAPIWANGGMGADSGFGDVESFTMILVTHFGEIVTTRHSWPSKCANDEISWLVAVPLDTSYFR